MTGRTASALWRAEPALLLALDEHLGPPVDSYVNGSQVWLVDLGPAGETLEFRLHPVAAYVPVPGLSHHDLWEEVVAAISRGDAPDALDLGGTPRPLHALWDGLEVFEAYDAGLEPATIASCAGGAIERSADQVGLVDHARIGGEWDRSGRTVSIFDLLSAELAG